PMQRGVRFKICANALAENGIAHERLWPGCQVVPAGLVEVVRLQREGFAYIKP
ncbi:MAG: DsrE family protein, partial [Desulfovibrio sp.]|nr:DsrE family protein [Desulfovibrio sp.]